MALKFISTPAMVQASDFARPGTSARLALESVPEARGLLPWIDAAVEGLLAAQPSRDDAIDQLTAMIDERDLAHDRLVRGIYGRLESEAALELEPERRHALLVARDTLFPKGLSVVGRSYVEQSGEARLRAGRMTPAVETTLASLASGDGTVLLAHYETMQATALEIGALVQRRAELQGTPSGAPRTVDARNRWIRMVNTLASVLEAAGVDETPILGPVRAAAQRAERERATRRRAASSLEASLADVVSLPFGVGAMAGASMPTDEGPSAA